MAIDELNSSPAIQPNGTNGRSNGINPYYMDMFNPYYLDGFAPLDDERNTFKLAVDGVIPEQLTGRYVRNGPNPTEVEVGPYNRMGGDGMVHGVELKGGRASWYAIDGCAPLGCPRPSPFRTRAARRTSTRTTWPTRT